MNSNGNNHDCQGIKTSSQDVLVMDVIVESADLRQTD